mgnify:CR=1 FL=1
MGEKMKKIRFGLGGFLMISSMLVSDSAAVLGVYVLAAVFHEMGHLLAAKILQVEIKEIAFGFSGVRIITKDKLLSYKNEFCLAMAGPLASFAVFFSICVCFCIFGMSSEVIFESAESFLQCNLSPWGALGFLAISSLIQAIINLLPVKTFDGGRMVYCVLAEAVSEYVADRVLMILSMFSAYLLWTVALYLMLRIGAGLGIYVFSACIFASTRNEDVEI